MKESNLEQDLQIDNLLLIQHLKSIESPFLGKITELYNEVKKILDTRIPIIFPNYTLHNTGHSLRIMQYMADIVQDLNKLNELEIVLMIYSALLHDIGMAVSQTDIDLIKNDDFPYFDINLSAIKKVINENEELALQEYIRKFHSSLSAKWINENSENFKIPNLSLNFSKELALICESHTKDFDWIKNNLNVRDIKGNYHFNSQFLACVLRLADILDIDSNRTPYNLYKLIAPTGISNEEWKQHFVISNNSKIEYNETTKQKKIVFHGSSKSAQIHRKILNYIDWVKTELNDSMKLVNVMSSEYNLIYDSNPEINIQTEGYSLPDYKMTLDFKAISALLMGDKIYGNKSLGLRELIQNSIDSCRIRQESENEKLEFGEEKFSPVIKVILDSSKNEVIIKDNGTGMSIDIIKKHFLNIGVSYYTSTEFRLKDFDYKPIGNFGIGFLSCFMLSDNVKVITRHYESKDKYIVELERNNEYTAITKTEDVTFHGTEVILNYEDFMNVFSNKFETIREFLGRYFLTDNITVELIDKTSKTKNEIKNLLKPNSSINNSISIDIDLSEYLKDFYGYAIIKPKNEFITTVNDLGFKGKLYIYDESNGIEEVISPQTLNLDDYIVDNEIKFINIPVVEPNLETEYLNGLKFADDVDEVISKLERELTWISILIPKNLQETLEECIMTNEDDYVLPHLTFKKLISLGHCESCETAVSIQSILLYEGRKNELYIPFNKLIPSNFSFLPFDFYHHRRDVYVRNVLIQSFRIEIITLATIFEIEKLIININTRKFVPDISRNNFDNKSKEEINYIIGKAIHKGVLDKLFLDNDRKENLKKFIDYFYKKETEFEK
ncbi:ATP-binding protein [Flavobacterium sp. B11]|uniref:HD domain-containing protein n=1 Tax=Flavobacterium movens TaxID=214860 RepID=UPI0031D7B5C1